MPRQQILTRLARHFDVVWVNPAKHWRQYWAANGDSRVERQEFREIAPGFTVMTPGPLRPCVYRPDWLRRFIYARALADARRYLRRRGATLIALHLWRYDFAEALDVVSHDLSCYHIDDEYSFSEVEVPNDPREERLLRRVDQVIVHSTRLLEKKGGRNPQTAMIPNGVDYAAFATPQAEPLDLGPVPRPRLGYIGVIKKQLNLGLLARMARARPDWSIVLVGPVGNVAGKEPVLTDLRALPNVYFLGTKRLETLPGYVQQMDACLMCYELNDYTKYIYPLKLHEYLAAGRPSIASPIDAVLDHADVVTLARTDEEWISGIAQALAPAASAAAEIARRRARARQYDWTRLAERVAHLFRDGLGLHRSVDPVTENPAGHLAEPFRPTCNTP
ncbi:MAG TPA: glycosyltransferase [Methylomirabilota bacterium]|nr:glycosyltransferase [Methylomirabilota bacterium]